MLEKEGKIVRINGCYLPTCVLMRRWLKPDESKGLTNRTGNIKISENLFHQIQELTTKRPELGYINKDEFIREAIRRFIQSKEKKWNPCLDL